MALDDLNPEWTSISQETNAAMTLDTLLQVDFDTVAEDDDGKFDSGGDTTRVTIQSDGIYAMVAESLLTYPATRDNDARLEIRASDSGGTQKFMSCDRSNCSFDDITVAKAVWPLVAGDYIECFVSHYDTSYPSSGQRNLDRFRFDIVKLGNLPGAASGAAFPAEGARVQDSTATVTTGYTPVFPNFDTELVDDDTMFDSGTPDRITVTTAGMYIVTGCIRIDRNAATDLDEIVRVDHYDSGDTLVWTTQTRHRPEYGGGESIMLIRGAAVGDYFKLRWAGSSSGDSTQTDRTFLSAVRIGARP